MGIDYGMGQTNIDRETGIRYGVINLNSEDMTEFAWEDFEADYGDPTCGKCGNELVTFDEDRGHGDYEEEDGQDLACEYCERTCEDGSDIYGEEPIGWTLDDGEYEATASADGDCFIVKSPYFTRAEFCSPCAPGAGHLGSPDPDGPRTYCFGHDWFRGELAPYPVYRVSDGTMVHPPNRGKDGAPNPAPMQPQ
jgi:hypothetical protein